MTMFPATKRPYTGGASAAAIELTLARVPVGVRDHLIHAWAALETAAKIGTPDDVAARQGKYARNRADCAKALIPTLSGVDEIAARAELSTLRDELRYF